MDTVASASTVRKMRTCGMITERYLNSGRQQNVPEALRAFAKCPGPEFTYVSRHLPNQLEFVNGMLPKLFSFTNAATSKIRCCSSFHYKFAARLLCSFCLCCCVTIKLYDVYMGNSLLGKFSK